MSGTAAKQRAARCVQRAITSKESTQSLRAIIVAWVHSKTCVRCSSSSSCSRVVCRSRDSSITVTDLFYAMQRGEPSCDAQRNIQALHRCDTARVSSSASRSSHLLQGRLAAISLQPIGQRSTAKQLEAPMHTGAGRLRSDPRHSRGGAQVAHAAALPELALQQEIGAGGLLTPQDLRPTRIQRAKRAFSQPLVPQQVLLGTLHQVSSTSCCTAVHPGNDMCRQDG